jgi:anti-anti-sigma factor
MTVKQFISEDKKELAIAIEGRFDFSLHQEFREAYINNTIAGTTFTIELSKATYMDSSALGMILLLKDHAEKIAGKLVIYKPNETVYKILEIAQFNKIMTIEH